MKYNRIQKGLFVDRPNRFVARVEVEGRTETVHVKNTGRCRELLTPRAVVYLEDCAAAGTGRKTKWDLIAVERSLDGRSLLINMDSQAPNKVVEEALWSGVISLPDFPGPLTAVKRETFFGTSRFDFYVEGGTAAELKKAFIEVKGVTLLEQDGTARFPDAPTERGLKHIRELCEAKAQGYEAYVIFVIQLRPAACLEPNDETQPAFGDALREAVKQGVHLLAYDCQVGPDSLLVGNPVPVRLSGNGRKEKEDV